MPPIYSSQNGCVLGDASQHGGICLGGACSFVGAVSPNNGLPLTQLALVDAGVTGLDLPGWRGKAIPFLYSWKCGIFEGDFSYRVDEGAIEILEFESSAPNVDDFPYPDFPVVFPPKSYQAKSLTLDERDQMAWVNGLTERNIPVNVDGPLWALTSPRHQFLGVPYLLDPDGSEKNCPQCSRPMFVLATIANQIDGFEEGFFGNDFVQVVYLACNECNVLSARNFAD